MSHETDATHTGGPHEESAAAELLLGPRPVPDGNFRGRLARRLAGQNPGWGPRPKHLWAPALGLVALGLALLLVGTLIGMGGS